MPIEQETARKNIILQEFRFKKPSGKNLKTLFCRMSEIATLRPNMTQGVIEGEWYDRTNHTLVIAKASVELWNKSSPKDPQNYIEMAECFGECNNVRFSETLVL